MNVISRSAKDAVNQFSDDLTSEGWWLWWLMSGWSYDRLLRYLIDLVPNIRVAEHHPVSSGPIELDFRIPAQVLEIHPDSSWPSHICVRGVWQKPTAQFSRPIRLQFRNCTNKQISAWFKMTTDAETPWISQKVDPNIFIDMHNCTMYYLHVDYDAVIKQELKNLITLPSVPCTSTHRRLMLFPHVDAISVKFLKSNSHFISVVKLHRHNEQITIRAWMQN